MRGHFEAKKHAIRQTQDGWVVSFVVHPNDMTPEFAAAPLGTRLMVGYAEIGEDEQPVPPKAVANADKSEAGKQRYREMDAMEQARTRAVALCKDMKFQLWASKNPMGDAKTIEEWMRQALNIRSRSEIATNSRVYRDFLALEQSYKQAVGLAAEPR